MKLLLLLLVIYGALGNFEGGRGKRPRGKASWCLWQGVSASSPTDEHVSLTAEHDSSANQNSDEHISGDDSRLPIDESLHNGNISGEIDRNHHNEADKVEMFQDFVHDDSPHSLEMTRIRVPFDISFFGELNAPSQHEGDEDYLSTSLLDAPVQNNEIDSNGLERFDNFGEEIISDYRSLLHDNEFLEGTSFNRNDTEHDTLVIRGNDSLSLDDNSRRGSISYDGGESIGAPSPPNRVVPSRITPDLVSNETNHNNQPPIRNPQVPEDPRLESLTDRNVESEQIEEHWLNRRADSPSVGSSRRRRRIGQVRFASAPPRTISNDPFRRNQAEIALRLADRSHLRMSTNLDNDTESLQELTGSHSWRDHIERDSQNFIDIQDDFGLDSDDLMSFDSYEADRAQRLIIRLMEQQHTSRQRRRRSLINPKEIAAMVRLQKSLERHYGEHQLPHPPNCACYQHRPLSTNSWAKDNDIRIGSVVPVYNLNGSGPNPQVAPPSAPQNVPQGLNQSPNGPAGDVGLVNPLGAKHPPMQIKPPLTGGPGSKPAGPPSPFINQPHFNNFRYKPIYEQFGMVVAYCMLGMVVLTALGAARLVSKMRVRSPNKVIIKTLSI